MFHDLAILYLIIINFLGFILMGIDKHRAIKHKWRIRERTLWIVSVIGGSAGSLVGMYLFRHKTKHKVFVLGIPFVMIVQLIGCMFVYYWVS